MDIKEIAHRPDLIVAGIVAVVGTAALFADYAKSLLPKEGDKIKWGDTAERRALRPPIENLMRSRGVKPVNDRDVA
jgi:hypothetical protein